jgi:hypothetical protein
MISLTRGECDPYLAFLSVRLFNFSIRAISRFVTFVGKVFGRSEDLDS